MEIIEIIGLSAATFTTASFIPQAYKIIKSKDTTSISLTMYTIFGIGLILWTIYGTVLKNLPIIVANLVTLLLASIILYYKIKEK